MIRSFVYKLRLSNTFFLDREWFWTYLFILYFTYTNTFVARKATNLTTFMPFILLHLLNTDRLHQVEDYFRGCTWQLKKVKTVYRLYIGHLEAIYEICQKSDKRLETNLDFFMCIKSRILVSFEILVCT